MFRPVKTAEEIEALPPGIYVVQRWFGSQFHAVKAENGRWEYPGGMALPRPVHVSGWICERLVNPRRLELEVQELKERIHSMAGEAPSYHRPRLLVRARVYGKAEGPFRERHGTVKVDGLEREVFTTNDHEPMVGLSDGRTLVVHWLDLIHAANERFDRLWPGGGK